MEPSLFTPILAGLLRILLAAVGGWLVAKGYTTQPTVDNLVTILATNIAGGLLIVAPMVWSALHKLFVAKVIKRNEAVAFQTGLVAATDGVKPEEVRSEKDAQVLLKTYLPNQMETKT